MTLYRTSGDSPIVRDLIRAAERGKQVVVLVEIKARFDEEANIVWARKLEQAGAHVVYGLVGLKTHSKVCPRRPPRGRPGLRRYVHIGTGNYNPKTARLYTDLGLLTLPAGARRRRDGPVQRPDRPVPAARRSGGCSSRRTASASRFLELVDREIEHAAAGPRGPDRRQAQRDRRPALDRGPLPGVAGRASGSTSSPRAACSLLPGVKGVSENISVRSIVGEFLEHSPDLGLRQRRRGRLVHRLGRPHGPQPRPAGRGDGPGRGRRGPGPDRGDRRGHARRRPPVVAAGPGRASGAGPRRSSGTPGTLRHPRGAQGAGARRVDGRRGRRTGRAPVSARSTRGHERRTIGRVSPTPAAPRPVEVELKYRRPSTQAAGDRYLLAEELAGFQPTARRSARPRSRIATSTRPTERSPGPGSPPGCGRPRRGRRSRSSRSVAPAIGSGNVHRREELEGPADRTAAPARLAAVGCPLADPRAVRRRAARRARHDPPAPPQADAPARRTIVELSLDEVDAVTRSRVVGRFVELEVELLNGDEAGARRDRRPSSRPTRPSTPSTGSKLESALAAIARDDDQAGQAGIGAAAGRRTAATADGRSRSVPTTVRPRRRAVIEAVDERRDRGRPAGRRCSRTAAPESDRRRRRSRQPKRASAKALAAGRRRLASATGRRPRRASRRRRRRRAPRRERRAPARRRQDARRHADDHVAEAGRKVLRFHLARMIAKEAGTRDGNDPEDLHAMRVATRRQRAAWRVFGEAFRAGPDEDLTAAASARSPRGSGAVRDLDVLLEAADAYRADLSPTRAAGARAAARRLAAPPRRRPPVCWSASSTPTATGAGSTTTREFVRHEGLAVAPVGPTEPHRVRDTAALAHPGRVRAASAPTSRSCAGPTSRRSTSCGSPASGCATRSSSSARPSARKRRR